MRPKLISALALLLLTGCGEPSTEIRRVSGIRTRFPDADLWNIPEQNNKFIVRDTNGTIWYVEMGFYRPSEINGKAVIFSAPAVYRLEK